MTQGLLTRRGRRARSVWDGRRRLRAVLDCLPVPVFVCDPDMRMVYVSPAARRAVQALRGPMADTFGVDVDDLLGMSIHRFHQDPAATERIMAGLNGRTHAATFTLAGLILKATISAITEPDGNTAGFIATLDDITSERHMAARLADAADELGGSSRSLAALAERLNAAAGDVTAQTTAVSTGAGQLDAAFQYISEGTAAAAAATGAVVALAGDAAARAEQLTDATGEIGGLIAEIASIAEQTKILALNATIEASRAGAAGRGFAVVADEVRGLSGRTRDAAARTAQLIGSIQNDAAASRAAAGSITTRIGEVDAQQAQIAAAARQQAATSREISAAITRVTAAIADIATLIADARTAADVLATQAARIDQLTAAGA